MKKNQVFHRIFCIIFRTTTKLECLYRTHYLWRHNVYTFLSNFYCSTNAILRSHLIQNELVKMNFLYSHCVPCLTYCADVKELISADMNKCNVALNDSIRLIYSYNRWESTRALRKELKFPNIVEIFYSRKKSFVENVKRMNNMVVRFLVRRSLELERSWCSELADRSS